MKAMRLEAWQGLAVLRDVDVPAPGEVLVQVGIDGSAVLPNTEYRS
jgi:hypothetical protein